MKKFNYYSAGVLSAMIAMVIAFAPLEGVAEPGVTQKDGMRVMTLEGSPREIGLQQGRLMKKEIRKIYKIYLKDLVYNTWMKEYAILGKGGKDAYSNPRKAMTKFARQNEEFIPPEYIEEMKGLAEGAGIPYKDVLNMNSHIDYFAMLCSTMVAAGAATPDGGLVEARNMDWAQGGLRDLDEYTTVVVIKPDKGLSFVSVIYPGITGVLTAVNEAGITAEINFSMAKKNGKLGMPALIITRHLIQNASTLDEAEELLRGLPRLAGYNIMVVDAKTSEARLIEVTSYDVGTKGLDDGILISTNHFTTKTLAGANIDASQFSSSPSEDRYARLGELTKLHHGSIDVDKAREIIGDGGVKVAATVQTVVFKPAEHKMWVWSRNRKANDFVEFDVKELLGEKTMASEVE